MSNRDKLLAALLASLVLAQLGVSLLMHRGIALTTANDLIQTGLLLCAVATFLPNSVASRCASPRARLFWMLMTAGMFLWLTYQGMWNYFEVLRHQDVPDPFAGDVVLFLHLVPMMAALALAPHQRQDDRNVRLGMLDLAFLLTWWLFLYVYAVIPWQYVRVNEAMYSLNFNQVYLTEKLVLLVVLGYLAYSCTGGWRYLYAQLLGASALYASSSYVANWAISRQLYYSGGIYDIPLAISIAWIALVGIFASRYSLTESSPRSGSPLSVWVTRIGMLAVFSLPLFALGGQLVDAPPLVRKFRVTLSLVTMIFMGLLVFWRQSLLGDELAYLLDSSDRSYRDLKALQEQLIQSEKLASLGRLVGGAAHEINNPLTAMLGYSDLLSTSSLQPTEQVLAERIGAQVRRTKTLVASLLTFASQAPASLSLVDLNSVVQTGIRLLQPQLDAQGIRTQIELGAVLPPVHADSNQLLHVCMHLASQTSHQFHVEGGSVLSIRTSSADGAVILEFCDGSPSVVRPDWTQPAATESIEANTLSLSACRRIVTEHGGRILSQRSRDGHVDFRLEIPAGMKPQTSRKAAGVAVAGRNS